MYGGVCGAALLLDDTVMGPAFPWPTILDLHVLEFNRWILLGKFVFV